MSMGRRRRNASPRKEKTEKTAVGVGVGNPSFDSELKKPAKDRPAVNYPIARFKATNKPTKEMHKPYKTF